jgi:hypothetical protein
MFRWPDAVIGQPQGPGIDDGWGRNGGHGGDEVDDGIEVVVIPIAADPRGVRWVRVGERRQPGEQDCNNNREYATGTEHRANHCRLARTSQVPLWQSSAADLKEYSDSLQVIFSRGAARSSEGTMRGQPTTQSGINHAQENERSQLGAHLLTPAFVDRPQ